MRYKTIDVEEHKATYKVFDKVAREVCARFDDLYDAVIFCNVNAVVNRWGAPRISHTLKTEPEYKEIKTVMSVVDGKLCRVYNTVYHPAAKYVILNDLGDIVTAEDVDECCRYNRVWKSGRWSDDWKQRDFEEGSRLVYVKGSSKKIKPAYHKVYGGHWYWGHTFRNKIWSYYRHPRTHGEKKQACAHADEYGDQIVRAARRYNNVPDAWDEYRSDVYATEKSWKHNSKRRKQWVPK